MSPPDPDNWKKIAWNNICLSVPRSWEVAEIGQRYLLLENAATPALELKWQPVRGSFSHRNPLRRLASFHGGRRAEDFREFSLTPGFESVLARYQVTGFSWKGRQVNGTGAVLYCPACKTASLIQLFEPAGHSAPDTFKQILNSFRDHPPGDTALWAVYDICAAVPLEFALSHFCFETGRFSLSFRAGGQTLHLHRWGPASALLTGRSLYAFAEAANQLPRTRTPAEILADDTRIEGLLTPGRSGWASVFSRLSSKPPFQRFRLWHLNKQNRILSARIESRRPIDPSLFEKICAGYESL